MPTEATFSSRMVTGLSAHPHTRTVTGPTSGFTSLVLIAVSEIFPCHNHALRVNI